MQAIQQAFLSIGSMYVVCIAALYAAMGILSMMMGVWP